MPEEGLEKRTCARFRIPGATVAYKRERTLFKRKSGLRRGVPARARHQPGRHPLPVD